MLRAFVCLAFALSLVYAVEEDHIADAHETIKLMMSQGADANACKDLAQSSIKDVSNAFDSNQAQLNALSTGSECAQNADRDSGVPAAETAVDNALAAQTTAKANLDAAKNVVPQIETPNVYALSLNSAKTCDWAYSTSYQTANAAMTAAQTTLTQATATVTATQSALSNAKVTSARQAKACQCSVVATSDKAWETVSAAGPMNDRATSWTKSQNILCALSGTSPCTFPSVPEATRPAFSPDTAAVADTCRAEAIAAEKAQKQEVVQKELDSKQEQASKEQATKENSQKLSVGIPIGCFRDSGDRDLPEYMGEASNDHCANLCRQRGYKYMGRQWHQQCFCGNGYGKYGGSGSCGDVGSNCAIKWAGFYGGWTNCVYQVNN
jgi:hypothetical protein